MGQNRSRTLQVVGGVLLPLACAGLGVTAALRKPLLESYFHWREGCLNEAGWLPSAEEVTGVRARIREIGASGVEKWNELQFAESAVPELLKCLARRREPDHPKRPQPGAPFSCYDWDARVRIELDVPHRRYPVSIGLIRSHLAWVGSRLVVIPPDDAAQLGRLIRDCEEFSKTEHGSEGEEGSGSP